MEERPGMSSPAPDLVRPRASPFRSAHQREADRESKREALLLASVRMFNDRGFSASSLDNVADALGSRKR